MHGGRHPQVVSGPVDFALLSLGLGGLIVFGPFGQALGKILFGKPTALGWLTMASGLLLVAILTSRRAWRRVVVYHVDPATLDRAVLASLAQLPGRFQRTVNGYEDASRKQAIVVESSSRWMTATIEAHGHEPERFVHDLHAHLRRQFRAAPAPPTRLGWTLLALSTLTMLLPSIVWLLGQPHARAALRVLFERRPG
jgi:hypothetical protein